MEQISTNPPLSGPSVPDEQEEYYKSDSFRMSSMKVLPCSKRFVHDWTECPFAHPQEKARRRDPSCHTYTGIACPSMKKEGSCAFGDHCPYAHNVFEYWLHPTRYRTQLCNDGLNCHRKICFFAHSLDELRVPACKPFVSPEALASAAGAAASDSTLRRKSTSGVVGSPVANLNIPPPSPSGRVSCDSARQSLDWGPVPMPANTAAVRLSSGQQSIPGSVSESGASEEPSPRQSLDSQSGDAEISPTSSGSPPNSQFSTHEQKVIETVTNMLASDKITPPQAATILQQMLPAASLQLLQSRLIVPGEELGGRRAMSDPLGRLGMQSEGRPSNVTEGVPSRHSEESSRSSYDMARMSFDSRVSGDFSTPRGSMEYHYATPAPAYPQDAQYAPAPPEQQRQQRYWTGAQLSPVPEGLPMINAPPPSNPWGHVGSVRHSTGNIDTNVGNRLSNDMARMSFDDSTTQEGHQRWIPADQSLQPVNPYASAFFAGASSGNAGGGGMALPQQQRGIEMPQTVGQGHNNGFYTEW